MSAITSSAWAKTLASLSERGSCGRLQASQKTACTCAPSPLRRKRLMARRYSPDGSDPSGVSQPYVREEISRLLLRSSLIASLGVWKMRIPSERSRASRSCRRAILVPMVPSRMRVGDDQLDGARAEGIVEVIVERH